MKKPILAAVAALFVLTACSSELSDVNVSSRDASRIQYVVDHRTNLCFAFIGSRAAFKTNATGIGMANVPCTDQVLFLAR